MKERWRDLELKTRIAYITAIVAFIVGWGLTIAGFIVPPLGSVADSILWILGQALLYAASVFGVGLYVTGATKSMRRSVSRFMHEERRRMENGEELMDDSDVDSDEV